MRAIHRLIQQHPNILTIPQTHVPNLCSLRSLFKVVLNSDQIQYWYEGNCPRTGALLRLPRTSEVEALALQLMQQLSADEYIAREGKMYGVLLVEDAAGNRQVLKAFSGLWQGQSIVEGWVPPIPGREQVSLAEAKTLDCLVQLKQGLTALQQIPERQQYAQLEQEYQTQLQQLAQVQECCRQERQQKRQQLQTSLRGETLAIALEELNHQSQREGIERRNLKRDWNTRLQPLKQVIAQADAQIQELKQQRKFLSRQLQAQMHNHYWLTNFAGESLTLRQLAGSLPTGTGDCCAPKLLHYAATHQLRPLAMAEFWWGPPSLNGDKQAGEFYGACTERCQPLMGFLLSGLSQTWVPAPPNPDLELSILYEDEELIAVNKPAGLLSVPGRYRDRQDSVLSRLQQKRSEPLTAIHRLDQDTSGILLLAKNQECDRQLRNQFQSRQAKKVYEAVLVGLLAQDQGRIDLPLWSDPGDRPYQKVDWLKGKLAITQFQVLEKTESKTRVEFIPITGRTHQLRVHAAHPAGLGMPILGDRLYGSSVTYVTRLHLHARELRVCHSQSGQKLTLQVPTPF